MSELENINRDNWREFVGSPLAVLMLGKTDCPACNAWSDELTGLLAGEHAWDRVRFGKLLLDQGGMAEFKKENGDWLKEIDDLPYNVIYFDGEKTKSWIGGGAERLTNRLKRFLES